MDAAINTGPPANGHIREARDEHPARLQPAAQQGNAAAVGSNYGQRSKRDAGLEAMLREKALAAAKVKPSVPHSPDAAAGLEPKEPEGNGAVDEPDRHPYNAEKPRRASVVVVKRSSTNLPDSRVSGEQSPSLPESPVPTGGLKFSSSDVTLAMTHSQWRRHKRRASATLKTGRAAAKPRRGGVSGSAKKKKPRVARAITDVPLPAKPEVPREIYF